MAASLGVALENARLFDETKRLLAETDQRAAELALVNEIGSALAKQLDFGAIIDLVGDRLHAIFEARARDVFVALYDKGSENITFPYWLDVGRRLDIAPVVLGEGLTSIVIRSKRPLRLATLDESVALGGILTEEMTPTESWLGVPIPAGEDVIGVVALRDPQPNVFNGADERLLSTIASSMGVALENARLFDETKRLLAETDERAAELAIVNEIGSALAKQLEFAAIIDLIGQRISTMFTARSMFVAQYDAATRLISFPFDLDRGQAGPHRAVRARPRPDLDRHRVGASRSFSERSRSRSRAAPSTTACRRSRGWGCRSWPAIRSWASSPWRASMKVRMTRLTSASCQRSPRAWGWPSRTRACSTRRSGSWPRRTSARRSWRSSTRSARPSPSSSTSRPSSSWSGSAFGRSSTPARSSSPSTTRRRTRSRGRTTSTRASASSAARETSARASRRRSSARDGRSDLARSRSRPPRERSRSGARTRNPGLASPFPPGLA